MEAKEKAEEFVLLFFRIQDESNETTWNQAKQCALIAVDLVLDILNQSTLEFEYWEEVKTKIEEL